MDLVLRNRSGRCVARAVVPLAVLAVAGCAQPPASERGVLDENPAVRIRAIKRAATEKDATQAANLIAQLSDEDAAVRFYAIAALKRLTGEDLDYRYFDHPASRQQAIERWQAWLREQMPERPATRPTMANGE